MSVQESLQDDVIHSAYLLHDLGYNIYATQATYDFLTVSSSGGSRRGRRRRRREGGGDVYDHCLAGGPLLLLLLLPPPLTSSLLPPVGLPCPVPPSPLPG